MPILGAHMSIAGGYYKAVEAAAKLGMDTVQVFTKNNNQWRAKPISEEEAARFRSSLDTLRIIHPLAHSCYLINLAAPDSELWKRSVDAMVVELLRAEQLGIAGVVLHPGAYTTSSEQAGLQSIARALDEVHRQTSGIRARCLLENTAGQGSHLGWQFEHLAAILEKVQDPDRLRICFDTCHAFAAGYELTTPKQYQATMRHFDRTVGLRQIQAFHLNDSKRELGSRVDRHEHIGQGCLGLDVFKHLVRDPRFRKIPMYLETPKGENQGEDWDAENLRVLRELALPQKTAK